MVLSYDEYRVVTTIFNFPEERWVFQSFLIGKIGNRCGHSVIRWYSDKTLENWAFPGLIFHIISSWHDCRRANEQYYSPLYARNNVILVHGIYKNIWVRILLSKLAYIILMFIVKIVLLVEGWQCGVLPSSRFLFLWNAYINFMTYNTYSLLKWCPIFNIK